MSGEEVLDSEDVTSTLRLGPGACSFTSGTPSAYFNVDGEQTVLRGEYGGVEDGRGGLRMLRLLRENGECEQAQDKVSRKFFHL